MLRINPSLSRGAGVASLVALSAFAAACSSEKRPPLDEAAWRRDLEAYRAQRVDSLKSDNSWLTLAGLFWLKPGANSVGSDSKSDVALPTGASPASLGTIEVGDSVHFVAAPNATVFIDSTRVTRVTLRSDSGGRPTMLRAGSLRLALIKRPKGLGIRVRDLESPMRKAFPGLAHFDPDTAWRVQARFDAYNPPKPINILDVTGGEDEKKSPGALVFSVAGREYRIDAITDNDTTTYWLIFKDATSGAETYGAGRYLHVPRPDASGHTVVDFNRAYNPPCAYTSFATCPLPPLQNKLEARVLAGEKRFPGEAMLHARVAPTGK